MSGLNPGSHSVQIRYVAILTLLCLLTACAGPRMVSRFETRSTRIELQELPDSKGFNLQVGEASVPLTAYNTVHIDGAWDIQDHSLILIRGSRTECPLSYVLVSARASQTSTTRLGGCGESYNVELSDGRLIAKSAGDRDQISWIFQNGSLTGPFEVRPPPKRRTPLRPIAGRYGPTTLPAISKPVGDEVIPPTVGGGSLPSGTGPQINVFSRAE